MNEQKALKAFYKWKGMLPFNFLERNKRSINSIEAELKRQCEKKLSIKR